MSGHRLPAKNRGTPITTLIAVMPRNLASDFSWQTPKFKNMDSVPRTNGILRVIFNSRGQKVHKNPKLLIHTYAVAAELRYWLVRTFCTQGMTAAPIQIIRNRNHETDEPVGGAAVSLSGYTQIQGPAFLWGWSVVRSLHFLPSS